MGFYLAHINPIEYSIDSSNPSIWFLLNSKVKFVGPAAYKHFVNTIYISLFQSYYKKTKHFLSWKYVKENILSLQNLRCCHSSHFQYIMNSLKFNKTNLSSLWTYSIFNNIWHFPGSILCNLLKYFDGPLRYDL